MGNAASHQSSHHSSQSPAHTAKKSFEATRGTSLEQVRTVDPENLEQLRKVMDPTLGIDYFQTLPQNPLKNDLVSLSLLKIFYPEYDATKAALKSCLKKTHDNGVISGEESEHEETRPLQERERFTASESKAMGCFYGNVLGDAIGAPLEFEKVRYPASTVEYVLPTAFGDLYMTDPHGGDITIPAEYKMKTGMWTDETAQVLCMADTLIMAPELTDQEAARIQDDGAENFGKLFHPTDFKTRLHLWWELGLNNGRHQEAPKNQHSIGMGSNLAASMTDFVQNRTAFTLAGDSNTNGNGTISRNGPLVSYYRKDINAAMIASYWQSRTTHRGDEAAECCRLLAFCCITAIQHPECGVPAKDAMIAALDTFTSPLPSVQCLARSQIEDSATLGGPDPNRNWNWKSDSYRYSEKRTHKNDSYIGSYVMDAMCMALHCVYVSKSFGEAIMKTVNICGDSDSVGAVAGQLAGSIWGIHAVPSPWFNKIQKWDFDGDILLRAYLTTHQQKIQTVPVTSEPIPTSSV